MSRGLGSICGQAARHKERMTVVFGRRGVRVVAAPLATAAMLAAATGQAATWLILLTALR